MRSTESTTLSDLQEIGATCTSLTSVGDAPVARLKLQAQRLQVVISTRELRLETEVEFESALRGDWVVPARPLCEFWTRCTGEIALSDADDDRLHLRIGPEQLSLCLLSNFEPAQIRSATGVAASLDRSDLCRYVAWFTLAVGRLMARRCAVCILAHTWLEPRTPSEPPSPAFRRSVTSPSSSRPRWPASLQASLSGYAYA